MNQSSNACASGGTRTRIPLSLLDDNVARAVDLRFAGRKKNSNWDEKTSLKTSVGLECRGRARVDQNNAISENSKIHAVTIEKCGGDTGAAPISNIPSNATRDIASKFVSKVFDESQSAVRFMYGGRVAHGGVMDAEVSDRAIGVGSNSMTVSNCEIPQFELRSSKYYDRENLIGDDDIVKGRGGELQACKGKTTDDYNAECRERLAKLSTSPKAQLICHEHDHNHDESEMLISTNVDIASNDSEFYPTTKSIETIAESEGTIKKYHAPNCNQVGKHRTEVPTAVLGHCRQRLWLDFGDDSLNEVGKTTSIPFRITATSSFTSTTSILIDFDRIPFEKGVDLFIGESLPEAITDASTLQTVKNSDLIEPIQLIQGESRTLHVLWTPVEMGAMREVIHLNLQSAKLEIFLNGIARNPRQRLGRESSHDEDLGNNAKLQEKVHTAKALHMKTFSKHESSAGTNILNVEESGIHVMPVTTTEFNAYNTYGDARWEQNCSNTFQCWLNDLFSYHDARNVSDNFDPNEEWNKAIFLFNSPEMKAARYTIETSVKSGRLAIKSDRNVMSNIDVQKKLTDLILSYSTRWLQLGLEIVLLFHDDRTHMKITKKSLKNLISQRLLSEPSTVLKYTGGRCKTPSGKFERELGENLQCHALTKILLLVVFLDRAKEERILGKDPCLFIKSSSLKSSKQVLESVSKECMGVEGLIIKHLERYGILLSHVQHPLDEYDLAIANLAVDLKDGVRLAKMVQLLSYNPDILSVMRIPADSRELRIHNIGIVLKVLRGLGVPNISDITSTHIVDGHRPRILQLLWATISHFRLSSVLQSSTIVREIERIKLQQVSEDIYFSSEKLTGGLRHGEEGEEERTAALLLEWSQMICSQYGISVKDLTNSFTDGTAFCSLIHFYHPMLVPRKEFLAAKSNAKTIPSALATDGSFHPETRKNENRNLSLAKACVSKLGGIPELFAEIDPFHPQREKSLIIGITYLFSRLTETREEVIAAFSIQKWYRRTRRLAEFKQKISSAQLILNGWRKHKKLYFRNVRTKYGESLRHIDSTYTASYKGRELVNRIITLTSSVVCIQSFFRGRRARREYRSLLSEREAAFLTMIRRRDLEDKSSILIQGKWRCFKAISTFRFLRKVIVLLQALHRCYLQKVAYRNVLVGVVKIQANWRSFRFYKEYTRQLKMIINLQAEIRKFNARKSMIQQAVNKKKKSIFHSRYLAWRCGRTSHSRFSGTVTTLLSKDGNNTKETLSSFPDREQCFFCITPFLVYLNEFRSFKEGQRIQEYASIQIQRAFRVFIEKRRYRVMRNASIEIQRFWRSFSVQLLFGLDKMDCIIVQSIVRRFLALKTASLRRDSILQIQSAIRSHLTRQAIRRDAKLNVQNRSLRITEEGTMQHQAAREIQNFHRHNPTRTAFLHKNGNAVLIQSLWRAISCKKNFAASKNAVILIQSLMRKCLVAKKFDQRRIHALTIQSLYRRRLRRCKFVRIQARNDLSEREHQLQLRVQLCRSSSEKILSTTCSNHVLTHGCHSINIQRQSVIVIQKYWRMYLARKLYIITFNAVLSVQVNTRRFLAINLHNRRSQVIKVQSICRGWLSRKSLKMDIQATIVLQSFCRFFQARILFRSIRKHLITLQAYCRGYQARNMFLQKFQSAIRLQKCFRGFIARTRYSSFRHAVIAIQAWIRKCLAENDYHRINLRFCHAQSTSRGSLCKQCILWKLMPFHAVVKIQSFYRCRRARCQYKYSIKSAVKIQSIIRRSIASKDLAIQIRSAIAIQKTWRRYSCRQQYLFELMDVVFAQSLIRRYLARQTYIKILNGTKRRSDQNNQCVRTPSEASPSPEDDFFITIGSTSFEGSYLNPGKSCQVPSHTPKLTSSQNVNSVEIEASIIIQKCWRCFTQYLSFAVMKFSAVLIQSVVRKNLIKSKYRVHLNEVCRGNGVGRLLSLTQQQGLIVPREEFDGGILARSNIRDSIHTTGRVQRRQLQITNDIFRLQEIAAKDIQRLWRGYRANVEFMLLVMASVKIQHFVRHWLHRRMQSEINHINAGFSVTKLPNAPQAQPSKSEQNGITGSPIIGLRDFPDFVTFKRPRSDVHRTNSLHEDIGSSESVVAGLVGPPKSLISGRAQVAFDVSSVVGFANRQEVSEVSDVLPLYCNSTSTSSNDRYTKKYGNFNRRIKSKQNVTNTSTHQPQRNNNQGTLTTPDGTRCASRMQRHAEALHILQTSKNLSDVMKSVRILEASTLESFTCCDEFAKADAHHILLSLALTCNRSEPHLELVRLILAILTNVVQHPPIVKSLATTFAADALIDLVQRYRDKSVHFVLSASLLNTILSRDCTLRLNYSTTERRKRLQGILMMCKLKATARVYDNAKMSHTLFSEGIRSLKSVTDLLDSGSR